MISPYLNRPVLPLVVALPRMLAQVEAELARSYHVGKSTISRLRDTAKQRRD